MKAVLYEAFGETPKLATVPDPAPEPHGVVIRVEATGICRSDWHGWMGHDPDIRLPHVPGHELAGIVAAVGRDVTRWKVGDRVTVPFVCGCGACPECHAGDQQVCRHQSQPGFTHWGSFAEYVAIHHADLNLVALPEIDGFRHRRQPRLPLRHLVPRHRRPGAHVRRRVGRRPRLRRRRPLGRHDRQCHRRQRRRHRHRRRQARSGRRTGGGRHRSTPRRSRTSPRR